MASVQDIVRWILNSFDASQTLSVERSIIDVLLLNGCDQFEASIEAEDKASKVLKMMQSMDSNDLPFEFSESNTQRLIGKKRRRKGDSTTAARIRDGIHLIPEMLDAIYACNAAIFERICARLMALSGATEYFVTGHSDEGGIDIFGRVPLRMRDSAVPGSLLHTSLLERQLLFLGQCKCESPNTRLGRPPITSFSAAVVDCLGKYEGNSHPPTQGVPLAYFRTRETCISVFFTTADYTGEAEAAAAASDVILVDGKQIAGFLLYHEIGLKETSGGTRTIDKRLLEAWASAVQLGTQAVALHKGN